MTKNDMNEDKLSENNIREADIKNTSSFSIIWLLPIIAALIGAWMLFYKWSTLGPLITIEFSNANGIEVSKTKIKSRNVDIGEVESVKLNENFDGVIVTARIIKSAEKLLVEDSKFWVVSPKITTSEITGLSTILSGVYIEASPGQAEESQSEFVGLEDAPVTPLGTPGLHITLNSNDQFAYSVGDPIIYKGLTVGKFEDIYFNFEERVVYYNAFINAPYHKLITSNTKFWDVSGLDIALNADGLAFNTGNIETLLTNGVTFDVPDGMDFGTPLTERGYFDIYPDFQAANDDGYKETLKFIVLVSDTIRGLSVGAPVEYRGLSIGHVISINEFEQTEATILEDDYKIPVVIGLQPGRAKLPDNKVGIKLMDDQLRLWIEKGLSASLKTGNILTGSLFIELQHFESKEPIKIAEFDNLPVIPTQENELTQFADKAGKFMDSLNAMNLSEIGQNANKTILELNASLESLQNTSKSLNQLLLSANDEKLIEELRLAIQKIGNLTDSYSVGSKNHEQINETFESLNQLILELSPLVNQINTRPNSLIFDSGKKEKIVPKKYNGDNQ